MNEHDIIIQNCKLHRNISLIICEYIIPLNTQKKLMIGVLTHSIRGDWNDINERKEAIYELCEELGKNDLMEWLHENNEDIYRDGRMFRDSWDGPYSPCNINLFDEEFLKKYIGIITYPEYNLYGYQKD